MTDIRLGLSENWRQFAILVVVNAFVGAMVGLERAALPLVAANDFGVASATATLSFIAMFGLAKALSNAAAGQLSSRMSRRTILITGWLLAFPVPLMILYAPSWAWIVAANAFLGMNQGLAWSATVIMKIDLVGPKRRGLAMGLNEFAGYLAVALAAFGSGAAVSHFGLRAGPAYAGIGIATIGLLLSLLFVRDTSAFAHLEQSLLRQTPPKESDASRARKLFAINQAGLVNNLNDGVAWGVFPLLFSSNGFSVRSVGALAAIYPAVWGSCQLWTGPLSDRIGRRTPVMIGMILQGLALLAIAFTTRIGFWIAALILLGVGTALVYPTLLAAVGDSVTPSARGAAVGSYRFWRDLGYCVGALLAGVIADSLGIPIAIAVIGVITVASGILFAAQFRTEP